MHKRGDMIFPSTAGWAMGTDSGECTFALAWEPACLRARSCCCVWRALSLSLSVSVSASASVSVSKFASVSVCNGSGIKCTSLIRDVMDVYLVELELEGWLAEAKSRWFVTIRTS